ncbi:type I site-specific deoxyribonuclease [Candidatus Moduliflexus flocculans]|uniref:Type I site-specific deoxyribonuclease n=1 Tax=Candidatus Moduliflexus flocculans TaxID=1499966 RepID=A0A081BPK4_9BACT|nr:type I site-specific deoxyribonuclease [Candidatus Moduliflexus flocculans]
MPKRTEQTSGSSYSLLALLKRTLYLHETSPIDELVEEVHERMMKDVPLAKLKQQYVEPLLRGNRSFVESDAGSNVWRLAEGNRVNDAVYEVFKKYRDPLSERQILNRLAKLEHIAGNMQLTLDLKHDPRFSDIDSGKYWILSEWTVINDYARSVLLKAKNGLTEDELIERVVEEYHVNSEAAIFIPAIDDRFVKVEKRWVLKRFVEPQKTKLRPTQIDRLYNALKKNEQPMNIEELTSTVLNLPANLTDVVERLTMDPRFALENGLWDIRERAEARLLAATQSKLQATAAVEPEKTAEESVEIEIAPTEPEITVPPVEEAVIVPSIEEEIREEQPEIEPEEEDELGEEEAPEGGQRDEYMERLRGKVIDFLQDAFRTEGVVYNAEIIDQFLSSDEKEELFDQFVYDHFVSESKGRILTEHDVSKFMIYLAEPTLNDKIIDPCCGTGDVLLHILEMLDDQLQDAEWTERDNVLQYEFRTGQFYFARLTEEERRYFSQPLDDDVARWLPILRFCKQQQLTGVDSDRFACRTAALNIAIQGFPEILFRTDNALASKHIGSGVYDMVIGDTPTSEDNPTRFLRRSLTLAKPGGKILLLLPDEMFKNYRLTSTTLRHQMVAQSIIKAIIRLPESETPDVFGTQRTLLYCLRKHHDVEQESEIFVGDVQDVEGLAELIEVLDDFEAPVSLNDTPIDGDIVNYVLSSYQRSAYNLFIEGLRRGVLQGEMVNVNDWLVLPKEESAEE